MPTHPRHGGRGSFVKGTFSTFGAAFRRHFTQSPPDSPPKSQDAPYGGRRDSRSRILKRKLQNQRFGEPLTE
ncbi:MAG: hypothetical protein EA409_12195 [Saprospirales bacterium]|nr:MAG: hypothetical protein EA409_12195 [Saprospirales bacterium]